MWSSSAHACRMKSATPLAHFLKSHKRFLPLLTSLYLFRNTSLPSNSFFSSRLFPFYLLLISSAYFLIFSFTFFISRKKDLSEKEVFYFTLFYHSIVSSILIIRFKYDYFLQFSFFFYHNQPICIFIILYIQITWSQKSRFL